MVAVIGLTTGPAIMDIISDGGWSLIGDVWSDITGASIGTYMVCAAVVLIVFGVIAVFRLIGNRIAKANLENASAEQVAEIVRKVVAGFGMTFVLIGFITGALVATDLGMGLLSNNWSSLNGKVIESRITEERRSSSSYSTIYSYEPGIVYEYVVGNETYSNDRIRYGAIGGSSRSWSRRFTSRFPVGSTVPVYYSSLYPGVSTLTRGVHNVQFAALAAVCVLVVLGVVIFMMRHTIANPKYYRTAEDRAGCGDRGSGKSLGKIPSSPSHSHDEREAG